MGADLFNEPWWSYVGGSPRSARLWPRPLDRDCSPSTPASLLRSRPTTRTGSSSFRTRVAGTTAPIRVCASRHCCRASRRECKKRGVPPPRQLHQVQDFLRWGSPCITPLHHTDACLSQPRAAWVLPHNSVLPKFKPGCTLATSPIPTWRKHAFPGLAKQNGVSWTFWAYCNPWRPMTMMDYSTNRPISVVKNALDSGLDGPAGPNQLPVASFTSSVTDQQVVFNGSASSDPDGSVASWSWNFGDGRSGTGATTTVTYPSGGTVAHRDRQSRGHRVHIFDDHGC